MLTDAKALRYDAAPYSYIAMPHPFQTTEQEVIAGYRLHYTMSRAKAAWLAAAFVLGVAAYIATGSPYAAGLAGGSVGVAVLHVVVRYLLIPNRGRRIYRQQKNLQREYQFSWDDQGVSVHAEGYLENLRWADITKAKENEAMVLLYRSDYNFRLFPRRRFSSAEEYAQFRSHLVPRLLG